MKKNILPKPDYIIVLGTTYSGSGAVYDYLKGREDLFDPLEGIEYQLPHMPNGLMALELTADKGFHPGTVDYVLSQFEKISKKLARPKSFGGTVEVMQKVCLYLILQLKNL